MKAVNVDLMLLASLDHVHLFNKWAKRQWTKENPFSWDFHHAFGNAITKITV